ncbi:hypothetical protein IFHNHDMJ_00488 [Synechococcus sp. CBW1107]|nr:hypothetical protein IFHNHDMJ_00488 [Synechococcus sp. CBW1107]
MHRNAALQAMKTKIKGPDAKGKTTFKFDNEPNNVVVVNSNLGYKIYLRGGNDTGAGSDGDDRIFGQKGSDQLSGGLGNDYLSAGNGKQNQNNLIGDSGFIGVGAFGGDDQLIGGFGSTDRMVGDSTELYGTGGKDLLQAYGNYTEMIGDAATMQPYSRGGNDVLTGVPLFLTRTLMYGDAAAVYGPVTGGNDDLISGQSDDFMYGDWEFTFSADLANDPYVFDIYDSFGFFAPNPSQPRPFSFEPVTFELLQQDFDQATGGAPPEGNGTKVSFESLKVLANQYNIDYAPADALLATFGPDEFIYVIPDRSADPLAPQGGADRFIFNTFAEGNDVIFDFNPAEGDRIVFRNGLTLADQGNRFFVFESERDTLITYGSSSILLPYFTELAAEDFIFGEGSAASSPGGGFQPVVL